MFKIVFGLVREEVFTESSCFDEEAMWKSKDGQLNHKTLPR